ncbi:hypothetical protein ACFQZS_09525 [Mucilaginibacter calamicampi]|uniref:Uncharacterized protein n=1 Tax=Mucilaginibacter calamicampi TaxID=1302352 RepID=A0ABW2Z0W5_9SPHI
MNNSSILSRCIQGVTILLAAFNGFLTNWAPPTQQFSKLSFEVGLISVGSLVILLLVISFRKKLKASTNKWYLISIPLILGGLIVGMLYKSTLNEYVIEPPGESNPIIIGNTYTQGAASYIKLFPDKPVNELIADHGGVMNIEKIWTRASINAVQSRLAVLYIIFVLLTVSSIFILAEGKVHEL